MATTHTSENEMTPQTFRGLQIDIPAASSHIDHLEIFNNEEIVIARYKTGRWAAGTLTEDGYFVAHDVAAWDALVRETAYSVVVDGAPLPPAI